MLLIQLLYNVFTNKTKGIHKMKKTNKNAMRLLCLLLFACLLCMTVCSCSGGKGEVLMSLDGKTITANEYEFFMTRVKGRMFYEGYSVTDASFWKTIISSDGMTYDEYRSQTVLEQAKQYLVADCLFDSEGLSLSDTEIAEVDAKINELIEKEGSRNKLNTELATYGINSDMLRDIFLLEARIVKLREHLYGKDGEKISKETKDKYFSDNYVAFRQMFIAGYEYSCEEDKFGDRVLYTSDKAEKIAYDTENGVTVKDEFGKVITDKRGDPVYFTDEKAEKVAYDTENGVPKYLLNSDGDRITVKYSDETLAQLKKTAKGYAEAIKDLDDLERLAQEYDESGEGDREDMYLFSGYDGYYTSQYGANVSYFDDIAQKLSEMKVGECDVVPSSYGFHIIYKVENEDGAYEKDKYKDAFADFSSSLEAELFYRACEERIKLVSIDGEVYKKLPKMAEVAINITY